MSKTTSGDFQDEEEDNDEENDEEDEGDDDDDDADEEEDDDDDDEEEEEKRNNFMKEDAWTEFRKGSNEEIGKRCRAVCKLAFSESLRREHNVPADLQLEKSARSWLSVYKKDGDWSELKKRTWAVYSFFRSVDSKAVEEVMLTIGQRGRKRGTTSTRESNSPTASLTPDANEAARLLHIRAAFPHLFEELNDPFPDRVTLDNESSGSANRKCTLWAQIAEEFFKSENTYENVCKDGMCTADLKKKVETLDPNKFQVRSIESPGSWVQGAWKHLVNRLSLHWSAWDVSGNQDDYGPDAWHSFELGHKSRARAADHSVERGTCAANSNTCTAVCLYAPFVFTTKEAMYAIVAPKLQIDSDWEVRSRSSTMGSATKPMGSAMEKTFERLADNSIRLMHTMEKNSQPRDTDNVRLFQDCLANPNMDEEIKTHATFLLKRAYRSLVRDASNIDAENCEN